MFFPQICQSSFSGIVFAITVWIAFAVFRCREHFAFATNASTGCIGIAEKLKIVTALAVRFSLIDRGGAVAAQNVFPSGNGLQVCGVDAIGVAAQVIERQAWRNFTHQKGICEAVGKHTLAFSRAELTVSAMGCGGAPKPATRRFCDLFPESSCDCFPSYCHGVGGSTQLVVTRQ